MQKRELVNGVETIRDPIQGIWELQAGGILAPVRSTLGYPPRVSMRIFLHQAGFCEMFACIVPPAVRLTLSDFHNIATVAEKTNREIGLDPNVNELVIRTRDISNDQIARLGGTNPMAFVMNAHDYFPQLVGKDRKGKDRIYPMVSIWELMALDKEAYYMIHEENGPVQERSIHGRCCVVSDGSWEISLGTGVRHARAIGDNGSPYVSVFGHELGMMVNSLGEYGGVGMNVQTNISHDQIVKLVNGVAPYVDRLREAVNVVDQRFGRGHVLEFRIMRPSKNLHKGVRDSLQIYDADRRLGVGEIGTLSGLKPSSEYLSEYARYR